MPGILLGSIAIVLLLATLIARIHLHWWWIRSFEFPRLQIAFLALITWLLAVSLVESGPWLWVALLASGITVLFQGYYILPFTTLWPVQVKAAESNDADKKITLLIANVLTPNRQVQPLIDMIKQHQPDIVLTLESDQWWQDQLDPALAEQWPYSVKIPLDNLYGMHLYSHLELSDTSVEWLIQDDIPSIHTRVTLANGDRIRFYALHPRPPAPSESEKSLWRDAELLLVGKKIHEDPQATLVAGDLNDVAWSRTTRLFCRVGGMLDPRRGRGLFSTFHAKYPVLRWPLDHIFVTEHFTLVGMQRLSYFGSDHFPILATFCYRPSRQNEHETPEANTEERSEASETIQQGKTEQQET
ncbi:MULTISPECIES: endonuclease/exonuclease/phosphatase family protein [unclassified Halomonas]|uniref:endonuclease/exonuclease/phosphatase family protein n=1 Tax=unclassified Halomonas TaxID=2609666 RepID=UPI0007DA0099|nr:MULTISPECIES: endonuclease/exonuclease/phosphatase family protein [unclassified Halomonas]MBT2788682.1 endonuclease/exonuclease/phosphatase family protein [Halomonas sp. ISL-106]MBT2798273.1 endonuclease/exonuclease/phosphatase family protein [Halomonas sp. ISL-104]OAL60819.1 endonuclease [Halomonas sp. ALS9]